jgi:hypothetical protein
VARGNPISIEKLQIDPIRKHEGIIASVSMVMIVLIDILAIRTSLAGHHRATQHPARHHELLPVTSASWTLYGLPELSVLRDLVLKLRL